MTDEIKDPVVETPDTPEPQEREFTPVEKAALDQGWKPLEDYQGDPQNWRSAELFVALAPFYKRIEDQSREIKGLRVTAVDTAKMFKNIRETEYNRAMTALKAEKRTALNEGDAERLMSIDEQIDDLREARITAPEVHVPTEQVVNPEFARWTDNNKWYETDEDLAAWADGRGVALSKRGINPSQVLTMLEKEVREKFPNKFHNPNRERPSSVEGGTPAKSSPNRPQLSEFERSIMKTIIKDTGMTEAQYMAEFAKVKD